VITSQNAWNNLRWKSANVLVLLLMLTFSGSGRAAETKDVRIMLDWVKDRALKR
jgi:hypothetical protein